MNPPTDNPVDLYRWCNERYWGGELPDQIPAEWNPRITRMTGRLLRKRNSPEDDRYRIELSENIRGDSNLTINVMVHEQVHLWQHVMADRLNDKAYADPEKQVGHPYVNRGHGRYFHEQMNRLNNQFPELKIGVFDDAVIELDTASSEILHGLKVDILHLGRTESALFHADSDASKSGASLVPALQDLYGKKALQGVTPFVTLNPTLKKMEKLTKGLELRKNQKGVVHQTRFVNTVIDDESTMLDTPFSIEDLSPKLAVPDDVIEMKRKLKSEVNRPLDDYLGLYLSNAPSLKEKGLSQVAGFYVISGMTDKVSAETLNFIEDAWKEAKPSDLVKTRAAGQSIHKMMLGLAKKMDKQEYQEHLDKAWLAAGPGRIGRKAFSKAFEKKLIQSIKKQVGEDATPLVRTVMDSLDTHDTQLSLNQLIVLSPNSIDSTEREFTARILALHKHAGITPDGDAKNKIENIWRNPGEEGMLKSVSGRIATSTWERLSVTDDPESFKRLKEAFDPFSGRISADQFVSMPAKHSDAGMNTGASKERAEHLVKELKRHQGFGQAADHSFG